MSSLIGLGVGLGLGLNLDMNPDRNSALATKSGALINSCAGGHLKALWPGVLAAGFSCWIALSPNLVQAKGPVASERLGQISQAELPPQGRETYTKILQGGPFPFEKDGVVFGNRERILPSEKRGYYREYTVKTPASRDRGAKRIVCGGKQATAPDACFYSDDHYSSFRRIAH